MPGHEETVRLLSGAGIPIVGGEFVPADTDGRAPARDGELAERAAEAAGRVSSGTGPGISGAVGTVVLKLLAPGFSHKSDTGFVALALPGREAVRDAALGMLGRLPRSVAPEGFLVQPMVRGGREMLIGAHADRQFGPVVAFGPGGVLVELLDCADFLMPPFNEGEAALFVRRNRAWPILAGTRGAGPADVGTIVRTLVALGDFMLAREGRVASVDLNPFIVFGVGEGGFALDCRIEADGEVRT